MKSLPWLGLKSENKAPSHDCSLLAAEMDSVLKRVLRRRALCEAQRHWMLMLNNEAFHSSLWTMKPQLSISVYIGPTGQQKWLISNKRDSQIQQLRLIGEEQQFEDYICKRKERKRRRVCLYTRPICRQLSSVVTLQRTNSHFSVIVIHLPHLILLLSPSCSAAASLQSGGSDRGSDVAWSEGKVRIPSSASG